MSNATRTSSVAKERQDASNRGETLRATELRDLRLSDLDLNDHTFQYRFEAHHEDLRRSLEAEGQKEAIDVRGTKPYQIVDGFRRVEALRALGWSHVTALVHHSLSDEDAHTIAFIKNVVRRNLSPLERAQAIHKARARGKSLSDISTCLGLSEKQVSRYEALLSFSPAIKKLLDQTAISMAHAKVLSDYGVSKPEDWVNKVRAEGWSSRKLKAELRATKGRLAPKRRKAYLRQEKDRIRFYAFTMRQNAPLKERKKVIRLMKEAIAFLEAGED